MAQSIQRGGTEFGTIGLKSLRSELTEPGLLNSIATIADFLANHLLGLEIVQRQVPYPRKD
jgi:hypothetical protein